MLVTETLLVTTGDKPRPRWAADRRAGVSVGENGSAGSELIEVGSLDAPRALKTKVVIPKVISEYDDDIGGVRGRIGIRGEYQSSEQRADGNGVIGFHWLGDGVKDS